MYFYSIYLFLTKKKTLLPNPRFAQLGIKIKQIIFVKVAHTQIAVNAQMIKGYAYNATVHQM